MAAKGFLIQEGKIVRPVEQITVAGNFYALLQGVQAVADDLWFTLPGASSFGSASGVVGGLRIAVKLAWAQPHGAGPWGRAPCCVVAMKKAPGVAGGFAAKR